MAIFAVSLTKSVSFRGVQQEFSNVYHYSGTLPDATQAAAIVTAMKNIEVDLHSLDVSFVRYRVWSAGGSPAANLMIAQGTMSGTGAQTVNGSMDRERAVLVRFANGIDVRGRPVYLRKWYHSCGNCAGVSFATAGILQNTAQIPSGDRSLIQNRVDDFLSLTVGAQTYNLCSKKGTAGGNPVVVHAYLEHHQLGDQWR